MLGLYFGGRNHQTTFGNFFGNIELDATLEEGHSWTAEVTSNPTETGAPITDHIIEQPDELKIRGFISDSPLVASQTVIRVIGGTLPDSRSQGAFDLLYLLIKAKETVTVYTKHRIYTDMAISEISIPRTPAVGEAIEFTLMLKKIRVVSTQTVEVPPGISASKNSKATEALGRKAEPTKNNGKKQPEPVEDFSSILGRVLS